MWQGYVKSSQLSGVFIIHNPQQSSLTERAQRKAKLWLEKEIKSLVPTWSWPQCATVGAAGSNWILYISTSIVSIKYWSQPVRWAEHLPHVPKTKTYNFQKNYREPDLGVLSGPGWKADSLNTGSQSISLCPQFNKRGQTLDWVFLSAEVKCKTSHSQPARHTVPTSPGATDPDLRLFSGGRQ